MFSLTVVHDPGDYVQEISADYEKLQINEWEILSASMTKNGQGYGSNKPSEDNSEQQTENKG